MSNRDERNRAIAREILTNPAQTYDQIADKVQVQCKPDIKRQVIYGTLQTDSFKRIMAEEKPKYYDENKLRRKLDAAIDATSPKQAVHKGYIELGMRSLGMLIDRNINENHDYNESELDKMRQQALKEAEQALDSLNPAKTDTQQSAEISAESQPIAENAKSANS